MNFAKLMSAQIAKSANRTGSDSSQPKFQKRSEVEAAREAAYRAGQAALDTERLAKSERKRKLQEDEAERNREKEVKRRRLAEEARERQQEEDDKAERERRKRLGLPELQFSTAVELENDAEAAKGVGEIFMTEEELIEKLRELNEPARLFGEDHKQKLKRYLKVTRASTDKLALAATADQPIPTTIQPIEESETLVAETIPEASDAEGRLLLSRQISTWFNLVLREWAVALAKRDQAVKETFAGQAAASSQVQAIAHLKPLFRKLEKLPQDPSLLPDDLLKPMGDIIRKAQLRRYVSANDGYLQLSIGKAAWPIGVTMVGIHERSARERINESDTNKAHIMSDEETRKILQSIKRCLSFAQTKWPPTQVDQLMG